MFALFHELAVMTSPSMVPLVLFNTTVPMPRKKLLLTDTWVGSSITSEV
jgi:hypothetical protein